MFGKKIIGLTFMFTKNLPTARSTHVHREQKLAFDWLRQPVTINSMTSSNTRF